MIYSAVNFLPRGIYRPPLVVTTPGFSLRVQPRLRGQVSLQRAALRAVARGAPDEDPRAPAADGEARPAGGGDIHCLPHAARLTARGVEPDRVGLSHVRHHTGLRMPAVRPVRGVEPVPVPRPPTNEPGRRMAGPRRGASWRRGPPPGLRGPVSVFPRLQTGVRSLAGGVPTATHGLSEEPQVGGPPGFPARWARATGPACGRAARNAVRSLHMRDRAGFGFPQEFQA